MRLMRHTFEGLIAVGGKCAYWRERMHDDDRFDPDIKEQDKRVVCTCFIEGTSWQATAGTLMPDCPDRWHCRYYVPTF
jgi:hypothetical protein